MHLSSFCTRGKKKNNNVGLSGIEVGWMRIQAEDGEAELEGAEMESTNTIDSIALV